MIFPGKDILAGCPFACLLETFFRLGIANYRRMYYNLSEVSLCEQEVMIK